MPEITGVGFVGLSVRDVGRSVAWYRALLNLELVQQRGEGTWHLGAAILREPSSRLVIGLSEHRHNAGDPFDESRTGLDHIEFGVRSRAELDHWLHRLDDLSVDHSGIIEGRFGAFITFRDPDNIQLEFFWTAG